MKQTKGELMTMRPDSKLSWSMVGLLGASGMLWGCTSSQTTADGGDAVSVSDSQNLDSSNNPISFDAGSDVQNGSDAASTDVTSTDGNSSQSCQGSSAGFTVDPMHYF